MANQEFLLRHYTQVAKMAFKGGGRYYPAYHRVVMSLTTSDPVKHIKASLQEAYAIKDASPTLAEIMGVDMKIYIYQQALKQLSR